MQSLFNAVQMTGIKALAKSQNIAAMQILLLKASSILHLRLDVPFFSEHILSGTGMLIR
jgi:hypothetical protein